LNGGCVEIFFGEPTCIHIGKHSGQTCSWACSVKEHTPECAQFKVIAQEGKMEDTFWGHAWLKVMEHMFRRLKWWIGTFGSCSAVSWDGGQENLWASSAFIMKF
jgi:hypothetical protein